MRSYASDADLASLPARRGFDLRPADPEDAEAIAAVWHAGWADGHLGHVPPALAAQRTLGDFRRRVPERLAATIVAVAGDRVVGFVVLHADEVEQVYVAREARGTGAADALLARAEEEVARRAPVAWLAVAAGNARARRFYERNGWTDAGPFDYAAQVAGGTMDVPCRRYTKKVARVGGC
jgi:ribosomal protein S18 acetylase RimI-like enzyme